MNKLFTTILFLFLTGCSFQSDVSQLRETASEMVTLIDAAQDLKLYSKYIYLTAEEEQGMEGFDKKHQKILLDGTRQELRAALIRVQYLSPRLLENNTLAVYESVFFFRPIWFIKQQGKWRMVTESAKNSRFK